MCLMLSNNFVDPAKKNLFGKFNQKKWSLKQNCSIKNRKTFCISFHEKWFHEKSEPIRNQVFNPNQSDLGLIQTEFSIRINPNESEVGTIQINSD